MSIFARLTVAEYGRLIPDDPPQGLLSRHHTLRKGRCFRFILPGKSWWMARGGAGALRSRSGTRYFCLRVRAKSRLREVRSCLVSGRKDRFRARSWDMGVPSGGSSVRPILARISW